MLPTRIYTVICRPKYLLMIFYTDQGGYQYRVLTSEGKIFGKQKIFYTENGAEQAAGRCLIEQNLGINEV